MIYAGLRHTIPDIREGIVSWIMPIVKDLVNLLRDVRRARLGFVRLVGRESLVLGQSDAGVLKEDGYEGDEVGDEVDEEDDDGDEPKHHRHPY